MGSRCSTNLVADERAYSRIAAALLAVLLLGYATLLFRNVSYAAGGPDESGYMSEARMFAERRLSINIELLHTLQLDNSFSSLFTPLGWAPGPGRTMIPTYPPGFPLHLMLAGAIADWTHAPFYISPLAAVGCLLLMFALGREFGLSPLFALAGASLLAVVPQFLFFSLQVMSDVLATFWALFAMWCAMRAVRQSAFAFAAGAAFAIGMGVRPTNALLLLPMAIAFRFRASQMARAAAGALPIITALMGYQAVVYGSPLRTGYGYVTDVVSFQFLSATFTHYSYWMARTLTLLIVPGGLLVVFDRRVDGWHRALFLAWFGIFFLFFCFWGSYQAWSYTRFLLPGTPALIFGSLLLVRDALGTRQAVQHRRLARVMTAVFFILAIGTPARFMKMHHVLDIGKAQSTYPSSMAWASQYLPSNALVMSGVLSGCFFYYEKRFTVRWDQLDNDRFQLLRAYAGNANLHWYAVLSATEVDPHDFAIRLHGTWHAVATYRDITLLRLDP